MLLALICWLGTLFPHTPAPPMTPDEQEWLLPTTNTGTPLTAIHDGRINNPRLWTRGAAWELGVGDAMDLCEHIALAPALWQEIRTFDGPRLDRRVRAVQLLIRAIELFDRLPSQPATMSDIVVLKSFIERRHHQFVLAQAPIAGFAHVTYKGTVVIPRVPYSKTGLPTRAIILHEMTHFFQITNYRHAYQYWNSQVGPEAMELAAMIVETREAIREGLTVGDLEWLDTAYPPLVYAGSRYLLPQLSVPRIDGSLLYRYVIRYGPNLNGDMEHDLLEIEQWTHRFETIGPLLPINLMYRQKDIMRRWAYECRSGIVSGLAAATQEYLGVNDCGSAIPTPHFNWTDYDDDDDTRTTPVEAYQLALDSLPDHKPDRHLLRAYEFLTQIAR
jgi:hypothetical protein